MIDIFLATIIQYLIMLDQMDVIVFNLPVVSELLSYNNLTGCFNSFHSMGLQFFSFVLGL